MPTITHAQIKDAIFNGEMIRDQQTVVVHSTVKDIPTDEEVGPGQDLFGPVNNKCGEAHEHFYAFVQKAKFGDSYFHEHGGMAGEDNVLQVFPSFNGLVRNYIVGNRAANDSFARAAVRGKQYQCVGVMHGDSRADNHPAKDNYPTSVAFIKGGTAMVPCTDTVQTFGYGDKVGFDWYTFLANAPSPDNADFILPPLINVSARMLQADKRSRVLEETLRVADNVMAAYNDGIIQLEMANLALLRAMHVTAADKHGKNRNLAFAVAEKTDLENRKTVAANALALLNTTSAAGRTALNDAMTAAAATPDKTNVDALKTAYDEHFTNAITLAQAVADDNVLADRLATADANLPTIRTASTNADTAYTAAVNAYDVAAIRDAYAAVGNQTDLSNALADARKALLDHNEDLRSGMYACQVIGRVLSPGEPGGMMRIMMNE
jgi:hypothetical protein